MLNTAELIDFFGTASQTTMDGTDVNVTTARYTGASHLLQAVTFHLASSVG